MDISRICIQCILTNTGRIECPDLGWNNTLRSGARSIRCWQSSTSIRVTESGLGLNFPSYKRDGNGMEQRWPDAIVICKTKKKNDAPMIRDHEEKIEFLTFKKDENELERFIASNEEQSRSSQTD